MHLRRVSELAPFDAISNSHGVLLRIPVAGVGLDPLMHVAKLIEADEFGVIVVPEETDR